MTLRTGSRSRALGSAAPIPRIGVLAATLAAPLMLGDMCAPADTLPDDVRTIEGFVQCLNNRAVGGDITDAVQCLPPGCTMTLTRSEGSAQPACSVGGCDLPRVLLNCPGPPQFQPSFSLCVSNGGLNRVEIGETANDDGDMRMGDVTVGPNYQVTDPAEAVSKVTGENSDSDDCWTCHQHAATPVGQEALSSPQPYQIFGVACVLQTDEPCKEADAGNCNESGQVTAQSLDDICNCLTQHVHQDGNPLDTEEGRRAEALCQKLVDYQNTRGICGSEGMPAPYGPDCADHDANCSPYDGGATVEASTGYTCQEVEADVWQCVSTRSCVDYHMEGGGKFLNESGVSFVRADVSGRTGVNGDGEVCDYDGILATIETFNHASNALTNTVVLDKFVATDLGGGDFGAQCDGTAMVNGGGPVDITIDASKSSGVVSFTLDDIDTPVNLAGATGETGRADLSLTTTPAP